MSEKYITVSISKIIDYPDVLGEILRAWAFVKPYGCYSCFDLIDGFEEVEVTSREFKLMWGREFDPNSTNDYWGEPDSNYIKQISWFKHVCGIEVGWFWDGDGTLLFYIPDLISEGNNGVIINDDCKKDYGWKFGVDNVLL